MNDKQTTKTSRFLSLVLRHQPDAAGVTLDEAGWVNVEVLLAGCARAGRPITREELEHIVETNAKKRFEFDADGRSIRASQGHSVEVDLQYESQTPPQVLYHGTASRFLDAIRAQGLVKMQRHHVHLSADPAATTEVGARRGRPVLLTIRAGDMQRAGFDFYRSTNGVWLVESVPAEFINFSD
ncbi:RNA 2'-phosphotransferase [Verrucomicrobiaceae bacterium SCGC AG-212-N21]|nr:RNA 2'-phosphotransferase [Verrucomicrobiaceae bacterium SCGC AG-212-N21]